MAGLAPVELSTDCDQCGLEGGVVELYDALVAACRFGLPASTRCKLCAAASEGVFDRAPARPLHEVPANRCPACLDELAPAAIDERSCLGCGASATLQPTAPSLTFATLSELEHALDAWAARERFSSREALASATFSEPDVVKLFAALQRKERIEIIADPFANMGMRTTGGRAQSGEAPSPRARRSPSPAVAPPSTATRAAWRSSTETPSGGTDRGASLETTRGIGSSSGMGPAEARAVEITRGTDARPNTIVQLTPMGTRTEQKRFDRTLPDPQYAATEPLAPPLAAPSLAFAPPAAPPPSAPPRAIVYPLVSVIAADGEIHPEERALIDRFLLSEGLAPLAEHEFCVHHPSEVAHLVPQDRREEVVRLMCESAAIDGMPDESERRVIRAYATAWDVDDEKIDFWMWGYETMNTSLARQLFLKLRRFVLAARWSDAESRTSGSGLIVP